MANSNISLTKTCKNCGLEKPLSAFLIMSSDTEGASYGNICSDCRKTMPRQSATDEGSTRSTTGVKIDSKSKVQSEVDKRKLRKEIDENYIEERDKRDQTLIKHTEKTVATAQGEKKQRGLFESLKPSTPTSKNVDTVIFGSEKHKAKEAKVNFNAPVDTSQSRYDNSVFRSLKALLGESAAMFGALDRAKHAAKNKTKEPLPRELAPLNEPRKNKKPF